MNENQSAPSRVVLVIDDEIQIRRLLRLTLEGAGYKIFDAATGQDGLTEAAHRRPDVVILDLGLPDMDGLEVLKRLREWSRVPVLVLSVRDGEEEIVSALDLGADDYMTKPFSAGELLARLRTAQRHSLKGEETKIFRSNQLEVDLVARIVKVNGTEVRLSATEYSLLRLFVQHAGKVLTHRQIMREVWGPNAVEQTHYLRVYMTHLREKLEPDASQPKLFLTEPGVGYRLVEH